MRGEDMRLLLHLQTKPALMPLPDAFRRKSSGPKCLGTLTQTVDKTAETATIQERAVGPALAVCSASTAITAHPREYCCKRRVTVPCCISSVARCMPCARVVCATRTHTPASPPFVLQCSVAAASFFATYNTRTSPTHARASAAMRAALRRRTDLPSAQPEEDASSAQLAAATTPTDADASIRSGAALPAGAKAQPAFAH